MKVYTDAEFERLYRESLSYEQIKFKTRGFDEVGASKSQWHEERYCDTTLASGIRVNIFDEQIYLNYNNLVEHDNRDFLTAKFYLSGYHSVICPRVDGVAAEYAEIGGKNYLFYLPNIKEIEQYWSGDRLKRLRLEIDSAFLSNLITELDTVPKQLQALVEGKSPPRFHFTVGQITPQMETIVQQIWQHPYQGAIARIYLEGKVWELFALQLAQLGESELSPVKCSLKPQSIDRIYQARDILLQRIENPPSVAELTQQIGICDRTLRRGFRELFGTTVIGYLNSKRIEQAQQLLREGNLSVSEVANIVGYSHLGHFSAAFKRQFGITPSECLAGKKICK
jgi:AraC-like DNA-binding protein